MVLAALALAGMPMIHYRYLGAFSRLDAGPGLGPWPSAYHGESWLTLVPVLGLLALMPPALARVYLVRHKPDWPGLTAQIARRDPTCRPCFFTRTTAPPNPSPSTAPANPTRSSPIISRTPASLGKKRPPGSDAREPDGFWLVLFLTTDESKGELPRIVDWARRYWNVEIDDSNRPMLLVRCRPLAGKG